MKIRCSNLGRLMGGFDRPKAQLSEDAKKLITEIYVKDKYGREQIIGSKEMIKGTVVEEQSISLLSKVQNKLYVKSKKEYENGYLTGHVDLLENNTVVDIKSPYNIWTFLNADMTSNYAWQLTGYMWLTGSKKAQLAYCLVDAPEWLIYDEVKRACYATMTNENEPSYQQLEEKVRKNMTYADMADKEKVRIFCLDYDEEKIELIKEKYKLAFDYYQLLQKNI